MSLYLSVNKGASGFACQEGINDELLIAFSMEEPPDGLSTCCLAHMTDNKDRMTVADLPLSQVILLSQIVKALLTTHCFQTVNYW